MNEKKKSIAVIAAFSIIILIFAVWGLIKPADKYSVSERRVLAQFPKVSAEQISSGKFMSQFETYSQDQFPMRDAFRSMKAVTSKYIFRQKANNGLYFIGDYLSKLEYPLNESRLNQSLSKINDIYSKYIDGTECSTYLSVVPDKNYFLAPLGGYPVMDYDKLVSTAKESLSFAEYIDVFPLLKLEDYYYTDQHWRQEKVIDVAETVAAGMGTGIATGQLTINTLNEPFYGAYCGQAALSFKEDTIKYVTDEIIDSCIVTSYNTGSAESSSMYDMDKAHGRDPYEMFLSGSDPLIVIENPMVNTRKELILFRDSFGSSLAPLLASGYSKIYVVDLRYINSDMLPKYISFSNQDVLFMYSTIILNNSISQ